MTAKESIETSASERSDQAQDSGRLYFIGLSFHDTSLSFRSRSRLDERGIQFLLQALRSVGCEEALVLSTCNRTEVYGAAPRDVLVDALCNATGLTKEDLQAHLTYRTGDDLCGHLFAVAAGADSAVLGETEIVAQVKEAWRISESAEMIGPILNRLLPRTLEVSKRIRTETTLCRGVTSIAALSVMLAHRHYDGLAGKRVAVVGAGQVAERLVKELHVRQPSRFVVLNRNAERANELATRFGGVGAGLDALADECRSADVVFTAVSSNDPVVTGSDLRPGSLVIDLGSPQNVDSTNLPPGTSYRDLDSVVQDSDTNAEGRTSAVPHALAIIEEELARYRAESLVRGASPTIRALTQRAEMIRDEQLRQALLKLPELDDRQRVIISDLTRRIVKQILKAPVEGLRSHPDAESRAIASRLFGLEDDGDLD